MARNLLRSRWRRKADGVTVTVVDDSNSDASVHWNYGYNRDDHVAVDSESGDPASVHWNYGYVRACNDTTGREFWVTAQGLGRKYELVSTI